jgi:hypothetical protein
MRNKLLMTAGLLALLVLLAMGGYSEGFTKEMLLVGSAAALIDIVNQHRRLTQ